MSVVVQHDATLVREANPGITSAAYREIGREKSRLFKLRIDSRFTDDLPGRFPEVSARNALRNVRETVEL